jgi:hypothetical protein
LSKEKQLTDVTKQKVEAMKRVEALATHEKQVVRPIGPTGSSVDNNFSLFGPSTTLL